MPPFSELNSNHFIGRQWAFKVIAPDNSVHNVLTGSPEAAAKLVAGIQLGLPVEGDFIVIREDDKVFRFRNKKITTYRMDPA